MEVNDKMMFLILALLNTSRVLELVNSHPSLEKMKKGEGREGENLGDILGGSSCEALGWMFDFKD